MKKQLIINLLLFLAASSYGQEFTDLYGGYLGQTPPDDTPVIFAPGIISRNSLEHSSAIFSPDGNEVYWCSREGEEGTLKIWRMMRINNRWTKPEVLNPFGDMRGCYDPFLSKDGKTLYFAAENTAAAENGDDIWCIEKQENGWTKPQSINPVINKKDGQCQASLTRSGTMYFIQYKVEENKWSCDIFTSQFRNGKYLPPDALPACINSSSEDWTPFIAPDESYLLFSSYREKEHGGIYVSFHDISAGTWSDPVSLGEPINTKAQEAFPAVSPDGKYLFFARYTDEKNNNDIYWVSIKNIDRLKEKNKKK